MPQTLLVFLISLALADGTVDSNEQRVLESVASYLGYRPEQFAHLLSMVEAQSHFHDFTGATVPQQNQLADAYLALGVDSTCGDRELKQAYRRLMSEHHPDKLIARGVPEEMVKLATEKSQEIQAAYELIKNQRRGV